MERERERERDVRVCVCVTMKDKDICLRACGIVYWRERERI